MSITINYTKLHLSHADRVAAALQDIKDWLGSDEKFDSISRELSRVPDQDQFCHWADFAGVRGFPVIVWYEHVHGKGTWQIPAGHVDGN